MNTAHQRRTKLASILVSGAALFGASSTSLADDFQESARTVYMLADYGLTTYKSLLLSSNDTAGTVTYGLGATIGQDKAMTIEHRVESTNVNFALPGSKLSTQWKSTIIKYRLWAFELGPVIGSVKSKANRAGTDIFDLVGEGYGGYFGIICPFGHHNLVQLSTMQVATSTNIEKTQLDAAMGPRLDMELSSRIAITKKSLDATLGYRRRSNTISEGGTAYKELQTSTFLGFIFGFDF